jgi:hypothetical protein
MAVKLSIRKGPKANLDALASADEILSGEMFLITDESRLAVGITSNTYQAFMKEGEVTGGGGDITNIDGGSASSVYLSTQVFVAGGA